MKKKKELAKYIVRKLTERPEVKDSDGFYNMQLDIEQMEQIVEKCIEQNELTIVVDIDRTIKIKPEVQEYKAIELKKLKNPK